MRLSAIAVSPVGAHNLAFIPTPTIGTQDCDLTITLKDERSPVWDIRNTLRKGLSERYPGTEFTFQPADLSDKILNFGSLAPIDFQINGPDLYANYEYAQNWPGSSGKFQGLPTCISTKRCFSRRFWSRAIGDSRLG